MKRNFPVMLFFVLLLISANLYASRRAETSNENPALRITRYPGNTTAFKIQTPSGIVIVTDPYALDEEVDADIVTESHPHADHNDASHITGDYTLITTPGEFEVRDIPITGVTGKHNKGDQPGTNIIYVFDLGDIRLAEFASQGEIPSEEMYDQIGQVDILIIQVFESDYSAPPSKLSLEEAAEIVERLNPKIILPAHGTEDISEALAEAVDGETRAQSGTLVIKQNDLDQIDSPQVIDLQH